MADVRFQSIFPSERGTETTIDILDTEYTGDPTPFNTDSAGYLLKYAESGTEQQQQFMSTQCEIYFHIEDETAFALVTDFLGAQEGRFMVRILEDAALYWTGVVLPDITTYDEAPFPIRFVLKAVDGVGALKDVPFKSAADEFYTGKSKVIEYITRALSRIVYTPEFYTTSDIFVRTSVDYWEETMTHVAEGADMLSQAYIDNAVYYTYKDGVQGVLSCYDVLKDILTSLELRLTYDRGAFHIEQLSYRVTETIVQRRWDIDATFLSSANYNSPNDIDQTAAGALLSTGQYEFTAPISKAEHRFAGLERRNFFAGVPAINETNVTLHTFYVPIHAASGATTLRLTGSLVLRISSNISEPGYTAPLDPMVAVLRMNFTLDTPNESLQRTYTLLPTYQYIYAQIVWSPTPGFYILQPIGGVFSQNTTDDIYTFAQQVDVVTPPLPDNTETFGLSFTLEALKKYDGTTVTDWATDFNVQFDFTNPWMEAYSNGGPVLSGDGTLYYTNNADTQNTLVWKTEGLIGSSFNPNTVGAIWVKPGADYILAELWGTGSDTPAFSYIGQMLTRNIAATHAKPARKLSGTLYGDISALSRVVWDNANWILIGGTWNGVNNLFSGTWLEMKETSGLTASNPIKFVAYPDPTPPTTSTETPGTDGFFRIGAPHGSVWYAIASTLTNENLRAGTPGSINIQDTLSDYDFGSGDSVAIINPLSGIFETLEISTTTSNGETAISVTGDLLNNYPIGSPIVRIPRIGGPFILPGGVSGQIMRHNGTKWTAYGTTALADGVVLTWTDVGGWAAAALPASGLPALGTAFQLLRVNATATALEYFTSTFLTANQTITLSGDVSGSGATAITTAIGANKVTLAMMAQIVTASFLGRNTASTGNVEVLSIATAKTMLGLTGTNSGDQTIALTGDVTGSGTGSFAATIASNAVTVAKMAQLAGLSILARAGSTTGNIAALTASAANQYLRVNSAGTSLEWGTITAVTGTGAAGQVAVFDSAGSIDGDVSLLYDVTAGRLQIIKTGTAIASTAHFEARPGSGGNDIFLLYSANMLEALSRQANTRNVGNGGSSIFELEVGGASAGDTFVRFIVAGQTTWVIGIDNTDNDTLRILNQVDPSAGAIVGEGIRIEKGTTTRVAINKTSAVEVLDIGGNVRGEMWKNVATIASIGTFALGTGAGTGASINLSNTAWWGNGGYLYFTSGTSPATNAIVATVTMAAGYKFNTRASAIVQGKNIAAALTGWFCTYDNTTGILTISYAGTLPASTVLQINILMTGL